MAVTQTTGRQIGSVDNADLPTGQDVSKLADGSVDNTEFQRLGGVTAPLQSQLDSISSAFQTLTDAATVVWDVAGKRTGNAQVTLAADRVLDIQNAADGYSGILKVVQGAGGSHTLGLPSGSKVVDGGSGLISLSTSAGAIDFLSFLFDGTNYFWSYGKNFT